MKRGVLIITLVTAILALSTIVAIAVPNWQICHGRVLDDLGQPLEGATCVIVGHATYYTTYSNPNGYFYLYRNLADSLASGCYSLQASKTGYQTRSKGFSYDATDSIGTNVGNIMLFQ